LESDLEKKRYKYSLHQGGGYTGAIYFVTKNQKPPPGQKQELQEIAEDHGGVLDETPASFRIILS
jgi:hypothetical protein